MASRPWGFLAQNPGSGLLSALFARCTVWRLPPKSGLEVQRRGKDDAAFQPVPALVELPGISVEGFAVQGRD